MNKIILLIIATIFLSFYGCEFYDHSNPLDPDYKGEMPFVKSVKQVYEIGSEANCIKAVSENNIYVGTNNGIYHYDGGNWTKMSMPIQNLVINDIEITQNGVIYSVGSPYKLEGNDSTYVFKYDGINWFKIFSQPSEYYYSRTYNDEFVKLSILGESDIYIVYSTQASTNKDKVFRWYNGIVSSFEFSEDIYDIKVIETNKFYVLGKTKVWSYLGTSILPYFDISGKSFTEFQLLNPQTIYLFGIQGSNDYPALYKYKDGTLTSISSLTNRDKVFGVNFLDENFGAIITGVGNFIIYDKGTYSSYNILRKNTVPLYDVEMISKEVGYAVGANGKILKYGDFPLER